MKVPINWLKNYVDINIDPKEFADAMTMSGSKVEGLEELGGDISRVVVGKILSLEKHPDADKLQISKVDVGNETVQIVTGADNIHEGDLIPVALDGALLPGDKKIKKGKLRGIESNGMMCSIQELGLAPQDFPGAAEHGIFILEEGPALGKDIREVIGLRDTVVEFEITPNRPDCLSMVGIAREAAVTLKTSLKKPDISVREEGDSAEKYASIEVKDTDLCPRYTARIVTDVKIAPSPQWMKERLRAAGVRPINNIVDITNYVMLELGQPMHAFDLNYLTDKKIVVRKAMEGEVMKTLDGQERKLDASMLVIADDHKPIGVAGVMGGENSEIKEDTTAILFESALFDGTSIRLTAKKLGLRTEASGRFEKGLDIENCIIAVNRAVQLVEELGAGKVCKGILDCYPERFKPRSITLRPGRVNELLGTTIDKEFMVNTFKALEFGVDEAALSLTVPSFRADVEREADLVEEVARFYGYNNIVPTLMSGKTSTQGKKTFKQKVEDIIKKTMLACGLYETTTYSFTSPKVFDKINLPQGSPLREAVVISNPLGEDFSIMRTTTLPDMLNVIATNYNRRTEAARLFELSYVYLPDSTSGSGLPTEKQLLTIGMYGNADFYDLKGVVEDLLGELGIKDSQFLPEKENASFHPGRTAKLVVNNRTIGVLGEIHPEVVDRFEGPERTYIGVVEVEPLVEAASLTAEYRPLPKFPAVLRDIAMLVKDEVLVKQIEEVILQKAGKILESVKLFDVYKGKQVPEGMKSVAWSITFRTPDRTLTDDEVNKAMDKILDGLKTGLGAELR